MLIGLYLDNLKEDILGWFLNARWSPTAWALPVKYWNLNMIILVMMVVVLMNI